MTTITCTAYNGGLVATHDLRTCLSRIAVKEHACMRCEQAVKFMIDHKAEIEALKEKFSKRIKSKGMLGTDSNGNHVMGVSGTDKPDKPKKNYTIPGYVGVGAEWKEKVGGNIYPGKVIAVHDNMKTLAIEQPFEPTTTPPLCPRCNRRPQHPRQKYGQPAWSGACLECLRTTRREAEQQRRANREWKITLDFSQEQEFLNILREHARANRRTLEAEIMFRLEQGGD